MIEIVALAVRPAVSVAVTWSVRRAPPGLLTVVEKDPLHPIVTVFVE
jgi:hypothetical protein